MARVSPPGRGSLPGDLVAPKVFKDEGLVFSVLKSLSLAEVRKLWNVSLAFYNELDSKVVPLLALYEHDWAIVSQYMDQGFGSPQGRPRFEYNRDNICVEAILHQRFEGLRLLARRRYDFSSARRDPRLRDFVCEAVRQGGYEHVEHLCLLKAVLQDGYDDALLEAQALEPGGISEGLQAERSVTVDFLGTRLAYRCSGLDFAGSGYIEQQLAALSCNRDHLFKVPFVVAAFIRAGAAPCYFLRPEGCGYLLVLAVASESFNFVYLLAKEAIHLEAVFELYSAQILRMALRALEHRRFAVLELLGFCGFALAEEDAVQRSFDEFVLKCLLAEDFAPVERLCRLNFSLHRFAERNLSEFQAFVQARLATGDGEGSPAAAREGAHSALRRLARLDRRALELHFQGDAFLAHAGELLSRKSFAALRRIVEVHPRALDTYFAKRHVQMEALLLDAFLLRDMALVADLASISFPMGPFFARHRAEVDAVLLGCWLPHKCWTELGMLRGDVRQWSFPVFFERNQSRSDDFVLRIIEDGYWFDLHNLEQLSFDFIAFFDRRFREVSAAVFGFISAPQPHFVLLRELSALGFPWPRFIEAHPEQINASKDHDFLKFVISLEGFEVGSRVYEVVEETYSLYHSMAASMFDSSSTGGRPIVARRDRLEGLRGREVSPSAAASPSSPAAGQGCQGLVSRQAAQQAVVPDMQPHADGSELSSEEVRRSLRARARDLARKARERRIDVRKIVVLMTYKGAYCWNPLGIDAHHESPSWADVECVLTFLESRKEPPMAGAPPGIPPVALAALPAGPAAAGPAAAAAAAVAAPGAVAAAIQAGLPLTFPAPAAMGAVPLRNQLLFHVVCLAQRGEERTFIPQIDLFWAGILEDVLPVLPSS